MSLEEWINKIHCGACSEIMIRMQDKPIASNKIGRICLVCRKIFYIKESRLKHNRGITCSKKCQSILVSRKLTKGKKLKCPVCDKEFYCSQSRTRDAKYTPVCSRRCLYDGRKLGIIRREVKNKYNVSPTHINLVCECCGDEFSVRLTDKDKKYCSRKCFLEEHKNNMKGNKNPSWIDGRSYRKGSYRGDGWEIIRKKVYKRDNYTCQICGTKCISRRDLNENNSSHLIQCHHIFGYKSEIDNKLENLITLCVVCHTKIHNEVDRYDRITNKQNNLWELRRSVEATIN